MTLIALHIISRAATGVGEVGQVPRGAMVGAGGCQNSNLQWDSGKNRKVPKLSWQDVEAGDSNLINLIKSEDLV